MSDNIYELRRQHLQKQREAGNPYPNDFCRSHQADALLAAHGEHTREQLENQAITVQIAGRIMLQRNMGKAMFLTIDDSSNKIQIYATQNALGDEQFTQTNQLDLGDIIGCHGVLFKTKTGELTVRASHIRLLCKSLHPPPDKFHGLTDTDARYRRRYISLMSNPAERQIFTTRAKIIAFIRNYLNQQGYLEVETPVLQPIPGGAAARPFITHYNALGENFYLRIAQELYIKRLLVAGFDKVYELSKNFRNEGTSPRHNPEFTMLEFNAAYQNYQNFIDLTEDLLHQLVLTINGSDTIHYQGHDISFKRPFARVSPVQALQQHLPDVTPSDLHNKDYLQKALSQYEGSKAENTANLQTDQLQLLLFEKAVEDNLIQPTFLIDYPAIASPLARRRDSNPAIADRFELFIAGRELVNGFSELNDPDTQRDIFGQQAKMQDAGDNEAMFFDDDYIHALECGLPPNAGGGIGIDRLVMLLTNSPSIRDVILFPQLKSKK